MTKTYELILIAKEKLKIESDYGIAKALGLSIQNVSDYKNKPNEAKGVKLLQIIVGAGLSAEEALRFMTEEPLRKTGFATTEMMIAISGLSLILVTELAPTLVLALSSTSLECILC